MSKPIYNKDNFPEFDPANYEMRHKDFGEVGGGFTIGNVEFYLPDIDHSVWVSCNDELVTIHSADTAFDSDNSGSLENEEEYRLFSATFKVDGIDAAGPWLNMIKDALVYTIEKETEYRRSDYTFSLPIEWLPDSIRDKADPQYLSWLQEHDKDIDIGKDGVIVHDAVYQYLNNVENQKLIAPFMGENQPAVANSRAETQSRQDKAIIHNSIEGLGVYAAMISTDRHNRNESKVAEVRGIIENMASYWGLDMDDGSKPIDEILQAFDDRVDEAIHGNVADADTYRACADALTGLSRYSEDLIVSQGADAMHTLLSVGDLMIDVGEYFGFGQEVTFAEDSARWINNSVRGLLQDYDMPGTATVGGNNDALYAGDENYNVKGYVIKQAVLFENNVGFAFAHDPKAPSPFVTWRMFHDAEKGKLEYEWGKYHSDETKALACYVSRATEYEQRDKVKEIALPVAVTAPAEELEAPEVQKLIRFIDSGYREQFKIPDGESIRVTYPASDGREPAERECKYEGETHVSIGGSFYHIAEFAGAMERVGARVEPVNQLQNAKLTPFAAEVGEDKFYTHNREEGNTCAGVLVGNFGNNNEGDRFSASWREKDNGLFNGEIQSELQAVVFALRQDLLKDRDSMLAHCKEHPEAKLNTGDNFAIYGFKLETESREYFVNCFVSDVARDSRFSIFAYADKPALELSQSHQATQEAGHPHAQTSSVSPIAPEPNEAEKNFAGWLAVTANSEHQWAEDEIYRLNGRGAMYYTGGEDGIYIRIDKDGLLDAGDYEGAYPHIGEAMFKSVVTRQFDSYSEAFKAAMEAGGKQFLVDMFGGSTPQPIVKVTGHSQENEKPSVMDEIRGSRSESKSPTKPKAEKTKAECPKSRQTKSANKKKDQTEL